MFGLPEFRCDAPFDGGKDGVINPPAVNPPAVGAELATSDPAVGGEPLIEPVISEPVVGAMPLPTAGSAAVSSKALGSNPDILSCGQAACSPYPVSPGMFERPSPDDANRLCRNVSASEIGIS